MKPLQFEVSVQEQVKAQPFIRAHSHPELKDVADGGNTITWQFCNCSLGTTVVVGCEKCKTWMNVTDYSTW